jgi:hypothetical protein
MTGRLCRIVAVAIGMVALKACTCGPEDPAQPASTQFHDAKPVPDGWTALFDGKALGAWKPVPFGGEGDVKVENGEIVLPAGVDLTGVQWTGEAPATLGYEISLEAMRVEGSDFFCCVVFPVDKSHCSFTVGGWGGSVVGLSSLDDLPAADNETAKYMKLERKRWYKIRVRVTAAKIEAWIDDEQMVDVETKGRKISLHPAVEMAKPLGLCSYSTTATLRNIRVRKLP